MLTVVTWLWGSKYGPDDVAKLAAGVRRHLKQPHRFVCFSEQPLQLENVECGVLPDIALTKVKGCFARLRLFDPSWSRGWFGDRIVCMDLDVVITGPLDPLFNRTETFMILQGANASNPCPFNGSLMMLRAGAHPEVWADFSLEKAKAVPFHEFPDDQGWIWHKLPNASGWRCGAQSGVWSFAKGKGDAAWPKDNKLPDGARIVAFPGHRNPAQFADLNWIKENWR